VGRKKTGVCCDEGGPKTAGEKKGLLIIKRAHFFFWAYKDFTQNIWTGKWYFKNASNNGWESGSNSRVLA
jgi:hypothetical protein